MFRISLRSVCLIVFSLITCLASSANAVVIDHNCTDIWQIPESAINEAKSTLHIAYGHTSHGSQIISGMGTSGGQQLDQFMTNNGAPPETYLWSAYGGEGFLDLRDTPFSGALDLGNPDRVAWEAATRNYLAGHADCNVIIWSWCGQASTSIENIDIYLDLMEGLIADYPDVHFVFMTGHLDGGGENGLLNLANDHIRNHCITHDRILYDFADIESYDPDALVHYMPLICNDACDYDSDGDDVRDANWALDWQATHVEGVDWWQSGAAHSQHLNGNRKGYAAWWLWATLAGWTECIDAPSDLVAIGDNDLGEIALSWSDTTNDPNEDSFIIQRRVGAGAWDNSYATVAGDVTGFTDSGLTPESYSYRVVAHLENDGSGSPCNSGASNIATAVLINTEPPAAPSDLVALGDSQAGSVALSWVDNADNEAGFIIQRQVDGGIWDETFATAPENGTSYLDESLAPGTYTYRIVASNAYGDSPASNEADAILLDIPAAPANLVAVGNSIAGTVSLTWEDNSASESYFVIQRQVDGGAWNENYATIGADMEAYLDDNLGTPPLPNGTYTYRVIAGNEDGESSPSNDASAVISISVPNTPTNLESELAGFDITLSWTDESDNEESFIVERAIDGGAFAELIVLPIDSVMHLDSALPPLHTYTYRVKATNNYGDSDYSNETSEYIAEESFFIALKQSVNGYEGCRDAYLDAQYPTYNYGGDQYNYVEDDPQCKMLISFELPQEVMGMAIVEARLGVYVWTISGYAENQYLDLYRVTEPWTEGTVDGSYQEGSTSWDICMGGPDGEIPWGTPGGSHDAMPAASELIPNSDFYPEFDITMLVQEWASGLSVNNGLLLVNDSVITTGIKASEYSEYGRPYLEITYAMPSAVSEEVVLESGWRLLPNYPNPANPATALRFQVAEPQNLQLTVYSIDGRRVVTLLDGLVTPGMHEIPWNGMNSDGAVIGSGVYFARLRSAASAQTIKILKTR